MTQKQECRCGNKVDELRSYFKKGKTSRVTLCDECAERYGFNNKEEFESVPYKELTEKQNIKLPEQ